MHTPPLQGQVQAAPATIRSSESAAHPAPCSELRTLQANGSFVTPSEPWPPLLPGTDGSPPSTAPPHSPRRARRRPRPPLLAGPEEPPALNSGGGGHSEVVDCHLRPYACRPEAGRRPVQIHCRRPGHRRQSGRTGREETVLTRAGGRPGSGDEGRRLRRRALGTREIRRIGLMQLQPLYRPPHPPPIQAIPPLPTQGCDKSV